MNILRLTTQRENTIDIVEGNFIFAVSATSNVELFDAVISELKTELPIRKPVLYFLSERYPGRPTFTAPKFVEEDVITLAILYFNALMDSSAVPLLVSYAQQCFSRRQMQCFNIPSQLCLGTQQQNKIPLHILDLRLVRSSLDVCKRRIDYQLAQFIVDAVVNNAPCTVFFFDNFVIATQNSQTFAAAYSRLHFDMETYSIYGLFQFSNFILVQSELKFDYENFQKIAFFSKQKNPLTLLIELQLSNCLKLLCDEEISYFQNFDIISGGVLVDNQRVPLQSTTLSQFQSCTGQKVVAMRVRDIYFFTTVPIAVLESRLRQQNIPFNHEDTNIEQLVEWLCMFFCFSYNQESAGCQFLRHLFQLSAGTLELAGESFDNLCLVRTAIQYQSLQLQRIEVQWAQFCSQLYDSFIALASHQHSSCTIIVKNSDVYLKEALAMLGLLGHNIEFQQITLYDPGELQDTGVPHSQDFFSAQNRCTDEQVQIFEDICQHFSVACTVRCRWVDDIDQMMYDEFFAGGGGILEQKFCFLVGKCADSMKSQDRELII